MRSLRLVLALLAAVTLFVPSLAYAEEYKPTAEEMEQGQKYMPTDSEMKAAGDPVIIKWKDFGTMFASFGETIWNRNEPGTGRANTIAVLEAGAVASIGLVFMWWGLRKVTKVLFAAFRRGRLST